MYKTDSFLQSQPDGMLTKVHAAQVTGLQSPPDWISPEFKEKKIWVLNSNVQLDEDGIAIQPSHSPYIWLGDIGRARPELWQADPTTGCHMIADPRRMSTAVLPMDAVRSRHSPELGQRSGGNPDPILKSHPPQRS